jgi:hypothetical protein
MVEVFTQQGIDSEWCRNHNISGRLLALFQQYTIEDLPKMLSAGLKNIPLRKYY